MEYQEQYYFVYRELVETGYQVIKTKDINSDNIKSHINAILAILSDCIETDFAQRGMKIHVVFADKVELNLSIFDYFVNLLFWQLPVKVNAPIMSVHLFFPENITRKEIKNYIDNVFVDKYRSKIPFIDMNQTIDDVIGAFRLLEPFQMYLANSLNIEDTIELMNKYPDFNDTIHYDISNIPLEEVKDEGMKAARLQIDYIKNSDHCLRDSFRTGEAISDKQYREVAVNIGTKPNGSGSIFPYPIPHSFMNGGLQTPEELCIDSSVGRIAQILSKNNVGKSGEFARKLENNNKDTFLNPDPNYVCDSRNLEELTITDNTMLDMLDLRYYRENPRGVDKLLSAKKDKHLIGKKIYFRSPMTCNSAAHGKGICRKCYGDLYFAELEVNCGQIAAESLSSIYTQTLLSAKHILESLVFKMRWNPEFYNFFKVTFNTIGLNDENNYNGWKMVIDEDIQMEDDMDEVVYNYFVTSVLIRDPKGNEVRIETEDSDNMYLLPDFYNYITNPSKNSGVNVTEDDNIEINMDILASNFPVLFILEMRNNELSRTMNQIKKLMDNKTVIAGHDRNSILSTFITTNIAGKISINSVHFEVLLMNQLRSADDELESPDWSSPNQSYQILPLSKALKNNKAIAVRLQSADIAKALRNPDNDFIHQPASIDLYYMERPQKYINPRYISDEYKPRKEEDNAEEPLIFTNPRIKCGRQEEVEGDE